MIEYFIVSLFVTFFVVRIGAHLGHDIKNYGTPKERSKTITGFIRKKTGLDVHHIHLGIILLVVALFAMYFLGSTKITAILTGAALSMISDQIFPLFGFGNYFSNRMIIAALLLHVFLAILAVMIF